MIFPVLPASDIQRFNKKLLRKPERGTFPVRALGYHSFGFHSYRLLPYCAAKSKYLGLGVKSRLFVAYKI